MSHLSTWNKCCNLDANMRVMTKFTLCKNPFLDLLNKCPFNKFAEEVSSISDEAVCR